MIGVLDMNAKLDSMFYSVQDVADLLNVSRQKAMDIITREMRYVNVGTNKRRMLRIPRSDYDKWQTERIRLLDASEPLSEPARPSRVK
jgi:predicted DNA-binding protein YlxM (UPF0122 family)